MGAGVTVDVQPLGRIRDPLQLLGGLLVGYVGKDVGSGMKRVLSEFVFVSYFLGKVYELQNGGESFTQDITISG